MVHNAVVYYIVVHKEDHSLVHNIVHCMYGPEYGLKTSTYLPKWGPYCGAKYGLQGAPCSGPLFGP